MFCAPLGVAVVGAGSSGTAGAEVGGGAVVEGAPRPFSRTDRGADVWVDMI